jgi:hypothetical protein
MIEFHDPRAPTQTAVTPYTLSIDLATRKDATVGFLANGFPDSDVFLEAVAAALVRRTGINAVHWNKGNASIPVSEQILAAISANCDAVIAGYGH